MMKSNLTFILVYLVVIGCSTPQKTDVIKYDEIIHKAKLEFESKEYQKSLENYELAFSIIPYKEKNDYFFAAAAAFHIKDNEKAVNFIISSIKKMNVYENDLLHFQGFQLFMNNDFFTDIKYTFPNLIKEIEFINKNQNIEKEIDSLITLDHKVRKNDVGIKELKRVDSVNINRVIQITKEHGWHPKMWLILWHQRGNYGEDNYVWNYFRPFINEQIKEGNIKKSFWSRYEDEKSMRESGKQIYGMYSGQSEQFPIEDVKDLDIRRETMGLPPLWYTYLMLKSTLAKEYKNTTTTNRYRNNYERIKL